jgi:hypothetical protein
MTTLLGDRWARLWQINDDPNDTLAGIKDLAFTLRRTTTPGVAEYDFIHTYVGPGDDPFEHTKFRESGLVFMAPPMTKLDPWKNSERTKYKNQVDIFLGSKPANMKQLQGKKIFEGQPETLTLYVLPQAISKFGAAESLIDLIVMTCEIDGTHAEQDGTAHGNPK